MALNAWKRASWKGFSQRDGYPFRRACSPFPYGLDPFPLTAEARPAPFYTKDIPVVVACSF